MASRTNDFDAVVVGAGAAGLAAARRLSASGLSTVCIEARERVGGRTFTVRAPFGFPIDLGAAYLHEGATNPLTELAEKQGFEVWRDGVELSWAASKGWLAADEARSRFRQIERLQHDIEAAGHAGRDVAAIDVIGPSLPPALRRSAERLTAAYWGVELEDLSTLDASQYGPTGSDFQLPGGYGSLVETLAAELRVELESPVERVVRTREGISIHTPRGVLRADDLVVAVPVGVLRAETIRFEPALPSEVLRAIDAVQPGRAAKVFLPCAAPVPGAPDGCWVVTPSATMSIAVRPFGRPFMMAYAGGSVAGDLEQAGPEAMWETAKHNVSQAFGTDVASSVEKARSAQRWRSTAWGLDPFTRGAYSAARPGAGDARRAFRTTPPDRIWFAGEHTAAQAFGTVHGAYWSGERAACDVLEGRARRNDPS